MIPSDPLSRPATSAADPAAVARDRSGLRSPEPNRRSAAPASAPPGAALTLGCGHPENTG